MKSDFCLTGKMHCAGHISRHGPRNPWKGARLCANRQSQQRKKTPAFYDPRLCFQKSVLWLAFSTAALRTAPRCAHFALRPPKACLSLNRPQVLEAVPAVAVVPREREVLELLSKGLPCREIADMLGAGIETVRKHSTTIQRVNIPRLRLSL
jgi:hypothetical protein